MLSSAAPSDVHNIKGMFKDVIHRKMRSVCQDVFMQLTIILSVPVTTASLETSFSRSPWCNTRRRRNCKGPTEEKGKDHGANSPSKEAIRELETKVRQPKWLAAKQSYNLKMAVFWVVASYRLVQVH
jgi:hypothetical protein